MISYDWKAPAITKIITVLVITSFIFQATAAQSSPLHDQQIILCLLPLDYANADELANTLTAYSGRCRPPFPIDRDHRFRLMPTTHSG